MQNYTVSGISKDGLVRGVAALTTQLVQELQQRHQTMPLASAALGRTATAGALMGAMLKQEEDRLSIQIMGDGPLGTIRVDANGRGEVRGMIDHPEVMLPLNEQGKLDVAGGVGQGTIYVSRDIGLKNPYQGNSPIISGEIAEDFAYYFTASEQIPSAVGLGVLVHNQRILVAGGFIIQVLPGATEENIRALEQNIGHLHSITDLLAEGITPEDLLYRLLGEETQLLEKRETRFHCHCSRSKTEAMLMSLGKEEIESIIREQGEAEVVCHFCNDKYHFSRKELEKVKEKL